MSSLKSLCVCGLLALCLLAAEASAEQSRLGVTVKNYASPSGALVTHVRQGYPATQMRRAGSSETFYLAVNAHVILEVNGTRVHSAAACIREIMASPRETTLTIYNRFRRTTRTYSVTLNGEAATSSGGHVTFNFNSSSWKPGTKHPTAAHVVAGEKDNDWVPAPGYRWSKRSGGLAVRWSPWAMHPDHPHVIAGLVEGRWVPEPGYQWQDRSRWNVVEDPDYWSFDSHGSSTPSPSDSPNIDEPNWGWKARQWEIRRELDRPYLPR